MSRNSDRPMAESSAEPPAQRRVVLAGIHPGDDRADLVLHLTRALEVGADNPGADDDGRRLPVDALVAAAREPLVGVAVRAELLLHPLGLDGRRRRLVQLELESALLPDLVGVACLHVGRQLLQRFQIGVEAGPWPEEGQRVLHAVLDLPGPGRAERLQRGDQRIDRLAHPRGILSLEHHEEGGEARGAGRDAVELEHARP